VLLDHGTSSCRGRAEVEAESVAYLICAGAGMETSSYSFPYVTVWSGGDSEVVRATAARVMTIARSILGTAGLASEDARQPEAA